MALDADIKSVPALPFAYPVAVKVLAAEMAHKSDVGGVMLGVANAADLLHAIATMRAALAKHGHTLAARAGAADGRRHLGKF